MNLAGRILKFFGWSVDLAVPDYPKCIYCVAPHTSNWDFILGELAIRSVGRKAGFLMKSSWFFFPLGAIFKAIGGVPVERKNKTISLTDVIVDKFKNTENLSIAITPEGTRRRVTDWHTGFLRISREADVPIVLAKIDAPAKKVIATKTFSPTGDISADMAAIKAYYRGTQGIRPENFSTDPS